MLLLTGWSRYVKWHGRGGCQQTEQKPSVSQFTKGRAGKGSVGAIEVLSLLSIPRKVYGKVIIERVQRLTEEKINEEQGSFRKGRGCMDQIFSFRMVVEKILPPQKKTICCLHGSRKSI